MLIELAAFIYLIGSIDVHTENVIFDEMSKLFLIDNGFSFPEATQQFFDHAAINIQVESETIPEETLRKIQKVVDSEQVVRTALADLISESGIDALFQRAKILIESKAIPKSF